MIHIYHLFFTYKCTKAYKNTILIYIILYVKNVHINTFLMYLLKKS